MYEITLTSLISVLRDFQGIPTQVKIDENTELENDLGITGDDGVELLELVEKSFTVSFNTDAYSLREIFDLQDNDYLFHSEGFNPFSLFFRKTSRVKPITVGQLLKGIARAKETVKNSV